jgi:phosphoglycolate phosphatase
LRVFLVGLADRGGNVAKAVLFDLDGTLTASGEGIIKSVQYALEKMGREVPDPSALSVFIGPPLVQEFMDFSGMSHEEALRALELYRERYTTVGLFENHPYQGIIELLGTLRAVGIITCVASSKPEPFVLRILDHFGMTDLFDQVVGATLDEKRTAKADVINEALVRLGMRGEKSHGHYGGRPSPGRARRTGCLGGLCGRHLWLRVPR